MAQRPIFFDTETTGTFSERDRIIELAAYDPHRECSFQRFINPGIPIPKDAIAIHEITDEMVKDAGNFKVVMQEFISFCDGEVTLIGHNSENFDLPFLRAECKRHSISLPEHWLYVDSLKWARRYRRDLPRHSLQYLRQMYGIKENKAHRALNDSIILADVFSHMVDDLTIEQVYSCLQQGKKESPLSQKPAAARETRPALTLFQG